MTAARGGPIGLLGGRVRLDQAGAGLPATIDPVLLAAAVPAGPGEAVLEAGAGVGTASLCLLARVPGVRAVGVERDAAQAKAACANATLNGWDGRFAIVTGDVTTREAARAAASLGPFAHAMANPPWFAEGSLPAGLPRRAAKHAEAAASLAPWVAFLARRVAQGGTVTLALTPAHLPEALAAFAAARVGSATLLPLWPRQGQPAKRLLLAGRKGGRGPCRILAGLVLHRDDGRFTIEAEAVLRHAEPLPAS
jgi:tRNA1(Val) A37 N6-methylase TrmN6